jgi:2-amino-4-hydroxy-6-hydroxymethyldihydropteridine diphosphokinase
MSELVSVYLSLGSNIGDRRKYLSQALDFISQRMKVVEQSSIYDTAPMENPDQARFLNMVARVETSLLPDQLLPLLKGIESKMGRTPSKPNSPRPIDIDILFYGDRTWNSPSLVIPHPKIAERGFVLVPLNEIAPRLVHPVIRKKVREMLKELNKGEQGVLKFEEEHPIQDV